MAVAIRKTGGATMKVRPIPETPIGLAADPLPIAVRAFAPPAPKPEPKTKPNNKKPARRHFGKPAPPSDWTLVYDTETTADAGQRLRIGAYQLRKGDALDEAGLFFDPKALSPKELDLLREFAVGNGLGL